jgi:hypothetical protein
MMSDKIDLTRTPCLQAVLELIILRSCNAKGGSKIMRYV